MTSGEGEAFSKIDKTPGAHQVKNGPKRDYDVGYGKPPVAHRFKHGNKANPKGRKKGSQNRKVVIHEVSGEKQETSARRTTHLFRNYARTE